MDQPQKFFATFGDVAVQKSFREYVPMIVVAISFFAIVQVLLEIYGTRFSQTVQAKPRDAQIEFRSYSTSLIHATIVLPISIYGMFYAW